MAARRRMSFKYEPKWPSANELNPDQVVFKYDREMDTMFVHFRGLSQPGISVLLDDHRYVRLDPTTHEVIGLQFEHFLSRARSVNPAYLFLARAAGLSQEEINAIEQGWSQQQLRRRALDWILDPPAKKSPLTPALA